METQHEINKTIYVFTCNITYKYISLNKFFGFGVNSVFMLRFM